MASENDEPTPEAGIQETSFQRERRRFSAGTDPNLVSSGNIDVERLQRLADEGQRARDRLCRIVGPCKNPLMWAAVGTLAVGIGALAVYGLVKVLHRIL